MSTESPITGFTLAVRCLTIIDLTDTISSLEYNDAITKKNRKYCPNIRKYRLHHLRDKNSWQTKQYRQLYTQ